MSRGGRQPLRLSRKSRLSRGDALPGFDFFPIESRGELTGRVRSSPLSRAFERSKRLVWVGDRVAVLLVPAISHGESANLSFGTRPHCWLPRECSPGSCDALGGPTGLMSPYTVAPVAETPSRFPPFERFHSLKTPRSHCAGRLERCAYQGGTRLCGLGGSVQSLSARAAPPKPWFGGKALAA